MASIQTFGQKEISEESLRPFLERFSSRHVRADVQEMLDEGFSGFDCDMGFADGDLHVEGGLNLEDLELGLLIINGNLVVDGPYLDSCNDGPDIVLVLGDLKAHSVFTAGSLEVQGNLTTRDGIIGDYNDGSALVQGDLEAPIFMPRDHYFDVKGEQVVDSSPEAAELAKHFHVEFLEDSEGLTLVNCRDMYAAIMQGKPVFKT